MHRHRKPRRKIGVPKGMLQYLSLKLIKKEPMSGSEIMDCIDDYTDWRPSPGSIYPMLASMQEYGLIEPIDDLEPELKRFQITEKGSKELDETRRFPDHLDARYNSMRKIYWLLHRDMPIDIYISFSNLLSNIDSTYEKTMTSKEQKKKLKSLLNNASKAVKELSEQK
jgi:DNA-binding PadR family transcriptional regulator